MIDISLVACVTVPIMILAATSRERAIYFLLLSVPFFGVTAFEAISHQFRIPELAVLALGFNQLFRTFRSRQVPVPRLSGMVFLCIFFSLAVVSVFSVAIRPASVLTHSYGSAHSAFQLNPLTFSATNITQLLLRLFTVVSVYFLIINLSTRTIYVAVRALAYGGIFTGIIGATYQIFSFTDLTVVTEILHYLINESPILRNPSVGPIPMMYSTVGEPGHTAQFFIFVLSMLVGIALFPRETDIFSRREISLLLISMTLFTLLTTSATAYGGLIILSLAAPFTQFFRHDTPAIKFVRVSFAIVVMAILTISALFIFTDAEFLVYQFEKLQFEEGSGTLRLDFLYLSAELLQSRPFLGLGTGSYYSTSLAGTLLVETGIVGFGAFVSANLLSYRAGLRLCNSTNDTIASLGMGLFIGGTVHFLTSLFAKSITSLLTPWFWLSLALPLGLMLYHKPTL